MKLPNPATGNNYTEKEILELGLPLNPICVGCNYHTTWQTNKDMRFVLNKVEGNSCWLRTRTTGKHFTTLTKELKFIQTKHNYAKYLQKMSNGEQRTDSSENIGRGNI